MKKTLSDLIIEQDDTEEGLPTHSVSHTESRENGFTVISSDAAPFSYRTVICGCAASMTPTERRRLCALLSKIMRHYIERSGVSAEPRVLTVGLGDPLVTPDSLGAECSENIIADGDHVFSFTPLTRARTGLSTASMVRCAAEEARADVIFAVDALAANEPHRLGTVVQITDRGIRPGSGVSGTSELISSETMPCPVLVIGVPTVVRSSAMTSDEFVPQLLTPSDIDGIVKAYSSIIACAVNSAFSGNLPSGGI